MDDNKQKTSSEKKKILEMIAAYGIGVYILAICLAFVANRFLNFVWLQNASILFLAIYVLYILFSTFNGKIKSVLSIDNKLLIDYLLIVPLILTCIFIIFSVVCNVNVNNSGDYLNQILIWLNNNDNIQLSTIIFFLFAFIGYHKGYEREKMDNKELNTSNQSCSEVGGQQLQIIENVNEKLERINDVLANKGEMAYTATCIPIKYNTQEESFVFVLIKNESHSKSQWMFPGSHVEVSNNHLNTDVELADINIIPSDVIKDKVKKEAGLDDIELLDPNYSYVNPDDSSLGAEEDNQYKYPNTCWPVKAPVFNYLFKVSESANCCKNHGHRCHYDFTYVGEYKNVNEDLVEYEFIEIKFNISRLVLKNDSRREDVAYIKNELEDNINQKIRSMAKHNKKNRTNIPLDALCLDSIPQMIYNTILFYRNYKSIKKKDEE